MKIIAITNQKGGVGKTTTATNLSAGLGLKNKKVLLLDLDPQANATTGVGIDKATVNYDMYDLIRKEATLEQAIIKNVCTNVDLVPSSINLAGADIFLSTLNDKSPLIFKEIFEPIKDKYDYMLIDCPPSLGLLNKNALSFANSVIIPIQTEYYALEGLTQLLSTISIVKKMYNPNLKIEGILLTMFIANTILGKEIQEEVKKFFKEKVYSTIINRNIKLAEAPSAGKTIFDYDKNSNGAKAYEELTIEFLKENGDLHEEVK